MGVIEESGSLGNKLQFESVNVEFFVVKDWLHLGVITEKRVVTRARARARPRARNPDRED